MNPLLRILYHILKTIVRFSLRVFYRRTVVVGRERLALQGPSIVLSNHPSTVMDPFNAVARVKRLVFFLANATLFKNPLAGRILDTLYCIKIERYSDTNGQPLQNEEAFAACNDFLSSGGCLYIAPEGTSEVERKLRRIKTGTARIALAAEASNDFQLGLQILPVGLNYSDPRYFREEVLVTAGTPIQVAAYREAYHRNPWDAVEQLTEDIRAALSSLIIDTAGETEELQLTVMESVAQTENPLPFSQTIARSQALLRAWRLLPDDGKIIEEYGRLLQEHRLTDRPVSGWQPGRVARLSLFLGAVPALYGRLNHLLPCGLPAQIDRRFNQWPCYEATFKYVAGLVFFPLFYFLQIKVVGTYTQWGWWYALSLPLSGFFADWYGRQWSGWRGWRRWQTFRKKNEDQASRIQLKRAQAQAQVEELLRHGVS